MTRTLLTPIQATGSIQGSGAVGVWTPADVANGNRFRFTGRELLIARNAGSTARSLTMTAFPIPRSGNAAASIAAVQPSYEEEVTADSPIHYWKWAADIYAGSSEPDVIAGRDALISSGGYIHATAGPKIPGINTGVSFPGDAADQTGYLGTSALLGGLTTLSVEAWLRPTGIVATRYYLACLQTPRPWTFGTDVDSPAAGDRLVSTISGFPVSWVIPATGSWLHVVTTLTGSVLKLYVNGALVDTQTGPAAVPDDATFQQRIGGQFTTNIWQGGLARLSLYNTALSPARILTHYNAGVRDYEMRIFAPRVKGWRQPDGTIWVDGSSADVELSVIRL